MASMRAALLFNLKDNFSGKRDSFYKDYGWMEGHDAYNLEAGTHWLSIKKKGGNNGIRKIKIINRALRNQNSLRDSPGG